MRSLDRVLVAEEDMMFEGKYKDGVLSWIRMAFLDWIGGFRFGTWVYPIQYEVARYYRAHNTSL
jgi:hypothetical protein